VIFATEPGSELATFRQQLRYRTREARKMPHAVVVFGPETASAFPERVVHCRRPAAKAPGRQALTNHPRPCPEETMPDLAAVDAGRSL